MQVTANVDGSSFYEVTFYAKVGGGDWQPIGTDDTAPYRVFHDVSSLDPGTPLEYRAVVLDNGGHTATSEPQSTAVPAPLVTIEVPTEGSKVRGTVEVRAVADPEQPTHVVRFERSVAGGAWTPIGRTTRRPVYTVFDDLAPLNLAAGTPIAYRASSPRPNGTTVTSAVRTVRPPGHAARRRRCGTSGPPATTAIHRAGWGLHMWGTPSIRRCSRRSRGTSRGRGPRSTQMAGPCTRSRWSTTATGQLHHAPAERRQCSPLLASRAVTGRSCRSTTRRSGSSRATRRSTPASRRRRSPAAAMRTAS